MIGQMFGGYRIVSLLGSGGMGQVWIGEHNMLGSRAAIKVLLATFSEEPRFVDRFFDEARAATRIHDPGIVTVLDVGWQDGHAYIVMELLGGQTLAQRLGHDRMPVARALRIAQGCALAMAAAHAQGIIHRDLKLDNIHLVPDPAMPGGERIKILDFGIAKLLDDDGARHSRTVAGAVMGTPAYMSPEQCRGAGAVDHRTDIYALGCVMFHLLCGRPPFIAPTPGEMIVSQVTEPPPPPSQFVPTLSPELDRLVLKCLAKDPEQRYASMTELVRACAQFTGENLAVPTIPPLREGERRPTGPSPAIEPPMAPRPPPSPPILIVAPEPPRPASRLPFALLSIALLAALVLAIIAAR